MHTWTCLTAVVLLLSGVDGKGEQSPPAVTIENGTIYGITNDSNNIQQFLGIPYAQPAVGDNRLRQATHLETPFGTLNATKFGPACYGRGNDEFEQSEDCLTLNIWRPVTSDGERPEDDLPVLVWLYGGSLTSGYAGSPLYEATNIVETSIKISKPIIVVSINYRVSSLGFLAGKEMQELGLLNIGMLDQRLALHWVQENIAAFGGDASKVTVAGQSAGAVSIYSHMTAYSGRGDGLFRGAILQSGGAFPLTYANTTRFQASFDSLFTNTSCSNLATASAAEKLDCIRGLPIDEFLEAAGSGTGQVIDGGFTTTSIQFSLPEGKYMRVALMVGTNTDEGTTSAPTGINTTDQLRGPVAEGFFRPTLLPNSTVDTLLNIYPDSPALGCPYNTGDIAISSGALDKQGCSIFGDIVQIAPARMIARAVTKFNGGGSNDALPVYKYRFNHLAPNSTAMNRGISTGTELPYVFSNKVPDTPWDQALARDITAAWASFTHSLDPNPERGDPDSNLPYWPTYAESQSAMVFSGYGSRIERDDYRAEGIEYIIDNVLPYGAKYGGSG